MKNEVVKGYKVDYTANTVFGAFGKIKTGSKFAPCFKH